MAEPTGIPADDSQKVRVFCCCARESHGLGLSHGLVGLVGREPGCGECLPDGAKGLPMPVLSRMLPFTRVEPSCRRSLFRSRPRRRYGRASRPIRGAWHERLRPCGCRGLKAPAQALGPPWYAPPRLVLIGWGSRGSTSRCRRPARLSWCKPARSRRSRNASRRRDCSQFFRWRRGSRTSCSSPKR